MKNTKESFSGESYNLKFQIRDRTNFEKFRIRYLLKFSFLLFSQRIIDRGGGKFN